MTTPADHDSDLRALFHDAVSDVDPKGGTGQILARAQRPSAGRWVPLTLAAAVATVVVIGGVAWLGRQAESPPAAGPGTAKVPASQQASKQPDRGRTLIVPVYYVGDTASGPRLFKEEHTVPDAVGSELDVAVEQALRGEPRDPDYQPGFRDETATAHATTDGSTITIDLSAAPGRLVNKTEEGGPIAVQALVWTAQAATSSQQPVRFTLQGQPVDRFYDVDTSEPVQRVSADSILSTVSISSPAEGAKVPMQFEVTGEAATFEANVVWELKQGDQVVRNGLTTAAQCCTLSPYKFTVNATPGDYTLVVHDTDESDGEGVGTSEDTKRITVQ